MAARLKYISALLSLLSLSFFSYCQTPCNLSLQGKVTDSENHLPVSYVLVHIKNSTIADGTDSLGQFTLNELCAGRYIISCERIGFRTTEKEVELPAGDTVHLEIQFDPTVFSIVDIVGEKTTSSPISVSTTLSSKELQQLRGLSLGESLKQVSGISSLNTGAGISKPVIHGLHSNRILILNNGIRQEGQQWGNEHAPEIDPFIADKITVVKGAGALRYGPDAIGGAILIEPKDLLTQPGLDGEVNITGATNGRQGIASAMVEGRMKKFPRFAARVQGTLKQSGNIHSPGYYLRNTGTREMNFSSAAGYNGKHFDTEIFYSQFNTDIGIFSGSHIGNLTDLYRAIHSDAPIDSAGFSYDIDRPYQHIEHELLKIKSSIHINERNKLNVVYARQYNLRNEFDKHRPLNDSLAALDKPELHLEITTHTADLSWEKLFRGKWSTEMGVSGVRQANTYEGRFFIPNFLNLGGGGFLITRYTLSQVTFEGALRYDERKMQVFMYENNVLISPIHDFRNLASSLGMKLRIRERWSFILNGGSAWRPPQVSELYSDGLHHGAAAVEIGDRTLLKEKSWSTTASIQYGSPTLIFEASPYYNYIQDFIYLSPVLPAALTIRGAFPAFRYKQTDAILKGIDLSTKWKMTHHVSIRSTASIIRAWNKKENDYLILMPADRYTANIDYNIYSNESRISLGFIYMNKQWRVPIGQDYIAPPSAYYLVSIDASSHINIKNYALEVGISVSNALNRTYRDYMNRFRYFTDEPGRNISIRVNVPLHFTPKASS